MARIEVEESALESIKAMALRLQNERDALLRALDYWLPATEPLRDQNDYPSRCHKENWKRDSDLYARCTTTPKVME